MTYICILNFPSDILCNLTIEVSRDQATRELRIIGSKGLLVLSGEEKVKICTQVQVSVGFDLESTVEDKSSTLKNHTLKKLKLLMLLIVGIKPDFQILYMMITKF